MSPTEYADNKIGGTPADSAPSQSPETLGGSSSQTGYTTNTVNDVHNGKYRDSFWRQIKDNQHAILSILKEYNKNMHTSATDPFNTFVMAYINHTRLSNNAWFRLQLLNNPKAFEMKTVSKLIVNQYPTLYLYLKNLKPTDLPRRTHG